MWNVFVFDSLPMYGSLTGVDFDSGSGGRDAETISAAAAMGSLVCSMVVAMPRRSVRGARRRVASRRAIVCGCVYAVVGSGKEVVA